jgi:hypothetical protein
VVKSLPDYVERRIVLEYGRQYAYLYMTTGDGKLIKTREESFKQPFRLELKEAREEAEDAWHLIYDFLNDTVNFPTPGGDQTAGNGEADGKPE